MGADQTGPLMSRRQKNVLLVVRWPVGGIRTFLRYVYQGLDRDEWRVSIVAPDVPEMRLLLAEDLAHSDIKFIPLDAGRGVVSLMWHIARTIAKGDYDLVHSHGFTSGVSASLGARLLRKKHLVTSHDVITANQFRGWQGTLKLALIAWFLNMADRIQSVSHDAQKNLMQYMPGVSQGKCLVIANGVEIDRFATAQARDFRSELDLEADVFLIGFFGRFMKQKGFRDLVRALEILSKRDDLPRPPLVLTFGDGGFIRRDRQLVMDLGLEKNFCFLPFTPNVAESIAGLNVVAMPSLWEACGLVAMETLVCGVPLIASNCIGLREVVHDTPASVFPAEDAEGLAGAIASHMAVDQKEQFASFRKKAMSRFDVKYQAKRIFELYEEMT